MALSRRGLIAGIVVAVVLVAGVAGAIVAFGGKNGLSLGPLGKVGGDASPTPPPNCPLTGEDRRAPLRPALAVKVENIPSVRPQTGLSHADIIYEEPVEAGITRFIVVYQCEDSDRVEPIRSARLTDPAILRQFGKAIFAYAGAVPQVVAAVKQAGLIDVNFNKAAAAYDRDPDRPSPHNLYSSTQELYEAAGPPNEAPEPIFTYSPDRPKGRKTRAIHVPFSSSSDVFWRWSSDKSAWVRFHGDVPHTYSNGQQVSAKNVVVQVVKLRDTGIRDVNGVVSPEVVATGRGTAYVLRNGRLIKGTWVRESLDEVTRFLDSNGDEISLAPGNTWVELAPNKITITTE